MSTMSVVDQLSGAEVPHSISFRRTSKSQPVVNSATRPATLKIPERKLWIQVLLNVYSEIAHQGEGSKPHREALEDIDDLRAIAAHLGYPNDCADRMIAQAVEISNQRKAARRQAKQ